MIDILVSLGVFCVAVLVGRLALEIGIAMRRALFFRRTRRFAEQQEREWRAKQQEGQWRKRA